MKSADAKAPTVLGEANESFEHGEIEGYVFVRTETKGDVVTHVFRKVYLHCTDWRQVAEAIKMLRVRGAPAIGVAAGYGLFGPQQVGIAPGMRAAEQRGEILQANQPADGGF